MVKFNNNLNNLFKNYQQQQKYAQKAFDVNGDGKVNSKDKKELDNKEKNLLKKSNLFDINGDGKFNQKDVDMFVKGDVDGNGKVSKEELNFISYYKVDFKSAMTKAKADFTMDGEKYVKGKLANGLVEGKYYKDGKLFTGTTSDGTTYKNGVFQYSIKDKNGSGYPKVSGNKIICKNGKNEVKITVNVGESAIIYEDGDIVITSKDKKTVTMYEANGSRISTITDNNGKGIPNAELNTIDFGELTLNIGNGDKAVIESDGTVTITSNDGKTKTKYDSKGKLEYKITNKRGKFYPKATGNTIIFSEKVRITLSVGEKALIDIDGEVYITSKDGKTKTRYYDTGEFVYQITDNNGSEYPNATDWQIVFKAVGGNKAKRVEFNEGDTVVINKDGSVTVEGGYLGIGTIKTEYDEKGNEKFCEINCGGETYKFLYDKNNNLISRYVITGSSVLKESLRYNKNNELISATKECDFNKDGIYEKTYQLDDLNYLNKDTVSYLLDTPTATITDRIKGDIQIVKNAEAAGLKAGKKGSTAYNNAYNASIKAQMIATPSNMKNVVGEVVEKSDGLYVNDGNKLVKLNISAETYLKLFPPIERYDVNQKSIGDCYFVSGCLTDMMKNPKAFSQLIQMFSENKNGDISIKFAGSLKEYSPVKFNKGELKVIDGKVNGNKVTKYTQANGSLGIKMLEQAYAISRFAKESLQEISTIDIDAAIPTIEGGLQYNVYKEVLGLTSNFDKFVDSKQIPGFFEKYATDVNNGSILFSLGFWKDISEYNIVSGHAYSVEKIDMKNQTVYITNPWYGGGTIAVSFDIIANIISDSALGYSIGKFD